ncbi:MAG: type II toxin-antitoxin system VapB family antitoxin [Rhizobiaceae bacterium]
MVIHVKDEEADALVRQLAESRGIGITTAIKEAAAEALAADRRARAENTSLERRIGPILERLDRLQRPAIETDKRFFDSLWEDSDVR